MSTTASAVWNNCLSFIEDNIQPQAFKTWFLNQLFQLKISDKVLNIEVPSKFFYEWLEEHYVKLLKTALQKELGEGSPFGLFHSNGKYALEIRVLLQKTFPVPTDQGLLPQDVDAPLPFPIRI